MPSTKRKIRIKEALDSAAFWGGVRATHKWVLTPYEKDRTTPLYAGDSFTELDMAHVDQKLCAVSIACIEKQQSFGFSPVRVSSSLQVAQDYWASTPVLLPICHLPGWVTPPDDGMPRGVEVRRFLNIREEDIRQPNRRPATTRMTIEYFMTRKTRHGLVFAEGLETKEVAVTNAWLDESFPGWKERLAQATVLDACQSVKTEWVFYAQSLAHAGALGVTLPEENIAAGFDARPAQI